MSLVLCCWRTNGTRNQYRLLPLKLIMREVPQRLFHAAEDTFFVCEAE